MPLNARNWSEARRASAFAARAIFIAGNVMVIAPLADIRAWHMLEKKMCIKRDPHFIIIRAAGS